MNNDIWYDFNSQNFSDSNGMYKSLTNETNTSLMRDYNMKRISDHLYSIDFSSLNERDGLKYASERYDRFACSSVRKGNYYGRNFDWYYDHSMEFVVRVGASASRYASIGVSSLISNLTDESVPRFKYSTDYEAIPYLMLDGINEKGVVANINVVPAGEAGTGKITTGTKPGKKRIPQNYLVRYILDNYATAADAVSAIQNDLDIYAPQLPGLHYEIHCMIGDKNSNYIVEFIDNQVKVTTGDRANIMTNFYIDGTTLTDDDKVDYTTITKFGSGYERYNLALSAYEGLNDIDDMKELMRSTIKYSNSYTNKSKYDEDFIEGDTDNFWYSEFVGDYGDYTIEIGQCIPGSEDFSEKFSTIVPKVKGMFATKDRDNKNVWITCHSTVYDIEKKIMWVTNQEGDELDDIGFGFNPDLDYLINRNC